MMLTIQQLWLLGALAILAADAAGARSVAVAPLYDQQGPAAKRQVETALLTPDTVQPYAISLPAPTPKELASLKAATTVGAASDKATRAQKGAPLKIGYMRPTASGNQALDLAALNWYAVPGGGKAARITVNSPGAAALRLGIAMTASDPNVAVRLVGATPAQQVFGPYTLGTLGASPIYWSPVLEGESAMLEIFLPAGVTPDSISLAIPKVGHMFVAGAALQNLNTAKAWNVLGGIGAAEACEKDVKCEIPTPALTAQAASAAMLILNDSKYIYQCTATLVNDSLGSKTPYLFTANHCLASDPSSVPRSTPAEMASTINTYWFFDAVSCGSQSVPQYALVAGGATLLGRGDDYDWALVRMNSQQPGGASFSAWRAEAMQTADIISVLHHPAGDLKKFSQGAVLQYSTYPDGSSFITVGYTLGATEPGSSGSGLLSLNSAGGYYELRGGLYGGSSDCSVKNGTDDYARLDVAVPLITQYLTPDAANPQKVGAVVEYYNSNLDDYFITADPTEISCLDTGCHPGWQRTGLRFLAYTNAAVAPAGASPVCRFYVIPQYGDSHFYSADPNECAQTAAKFGNAWVEESPNVFSIEIPNKADGSCPANTHPIYRFLNNANKLHHRYTAEVDVRNCLVYGSQPSDPNVAIDLNCTANAGDWIQEGYGTPPDAPVMCSPDN
jgi:lysyl endopeptidase